MLNAKLLAFIKTRKVVQVKIRKVVQVKIRKGVNTPHECLWRAE